MIIFFFEKTKNGSAFLKSSILLFIYINNFSNMLEIVSQLTQLHIDV